MIVLKSFNSLLGIFYGLVSSNARNTRELSYTKNKMTKYPNLSSRENSSNILKVFAIVFLLHKVAPIVQEITYLERKMKVKNLSLTSLNRFFQEGTRYPFHFLRCCLTPGKRKAAPKMFPFVYKCNYTKCGRRAFVYFVQMSEK